MLAFVVLCPLAPRTFHIASASMAPSLQDGDVVAVDRLAYHLGSIRRGDVIAFEDTERSGEVAIKRVVALPGDTVAIYAGAVFVNHRRQREPYLDHALIGRGYFGPMTVARGHVFVLGDNRLGSVDSRFSGPVPAGLVLGQVAVRLWPPRRAGAL